MGQVINQLHIAGCESVVIILLAGSPSNVTVGAYVSDISRAQHTIRKAQIGGYRRTASDVDHPRVPYAGFGQGQSVLDFAGFEIYTNSGMPGKTPHRRCIPSSSPHLL